MPGRRSGGGGGGMQKSGSDNRLENINKRQPRMAAFFNLRVGQGRMCWASLLARHALINKKELQSWTDCAFCARFALRANSSLIFGGGGGGGLISHFNLSKIASARDQEDRKSNVITLNSRSGRKRAGNKIAIKERFCLLI